MNYPNSTSKKIMVTITIVALLFIIVFLVFNNNDDIEYYTNPYVLYGEELKEAEIQGNKLIQENEKLKIKNQNIETEIQLLENSNIQSIELSHDKQYLAFDEVYENEVKMYIVNLETGEYEELFNIIDKENYNYKRYKKPHGFAWSPKENIIVFIGGFQYQTNDNGIKLSPRVEIYHPEVKLQRQPGAVSAIYPDEDIHGVRWDTEGDAIYYAVSTEKPEIYDLYRTSIKLNRALQTDEYEKIMELDSKELKTWLEKH